MPTILAYHPEIPVVGHDGRKYTIVAPAQGHWKTDMKVLRQIAKDLDVDTIGEVVDKLKKVDYDAFLEPGWTVQKTPLHFKTRLLH